MSASPDCQRWLADYKKTLAQKTAAQHLLAARNRARAAARRRLALLTTPAAPVHPPTRISSVRPHLSPAQMLKRFDMVCGDLPIENQILNDRMSPDEFISEMAMGGPVDTEGASMDGALIAEATAPAFPVAGISPEAPGGFPMLPFYGPSFGPVFGGGGVPTSPGNPSGPGLPSGPGRPGGPPVVTPTAPLSPVPEPSSVLLVLTGVFGACALGVKRSLS